MDLRPSDLALLVALDALLAEANVTRAAERLGVSQPAMSAQLARLRQLFDDPLLVASGRRMLPTARALALRDDLHGALDSLAQIIRVRQPFDPATSTRVFRIIAPDYLHALVCTPALQAVRAAAPGVQLLLLPYDATTAWQRLEKMEADLLVIWTSGVPAEARARPLYNDQLCLVQRIGHPRGVHKLTLDTFCELEHIVISPVMGALRGLVDVELDRLNRSRRIAASVPSFLLAPAIVAATDLVTCMPRRLAMLLRDRLKAFEMPLPEIADDMSLSWHPRMHLDAGHKWLRDTIVSLLARARPTGKAHPREA